jgi:hypothetical protein
MGESHSSSTPLGPGSLLRHPAFVGFWFAGIASSLGFQMLSVAVAWQIYAITGRALDLGLVGLAQFIPVVGLWMAMFPTLRRRQRLQET